MTKKILQRFGALMLVWLLFFSLSTVAFADSADDWLKEFTAETKETLETAHEYAEAVRAKYGYSAGADGGKFILLDEAKSSAYKDMAAIAATPQTVFLTSTIVLNKSDASRYVMLSSTTSEANILDQMAANSAAWIIARDEGNEAECARLHEANEALAAQLENSSYDPVTGKWSMDLDDGSHVESGTTTSNKQTTVSYVINNPDGSKDEVSLDSYTDKSIETYLKYGGTEAGLEKAYNEAARIVSASGAYGDESVTKSLVGEIAVVKVLLGLSDAEMEKLTEELYNYKQTYEDAQELYLQTLEELASGELTEEERAEKAALLDKCEEKMTEAHDGAQAARAKRGYTGDDDNYTDGGYYEGGQPKFSASENGGGSFSKLYKITTSVPSGHGHIEVDGGTMNEDGVIYAARGNTVRLTFVPDEGYTTSCYYLGGTSAYYASSHTFENICQDWTISVYFKEESQMSEFKLTVNVHGRGEVYLEGTGYGTRRVEEYDTKTYSYRRGTDIDFEFSGSTERFILSELLLDGVPVEYNHGVIYGGYDTYSLNNLNSHHTLDAYFAERWVNVNIRCTVDNAVSDLGLYRWRYDTRHYLCHPVDGWSIAGVTVNGVTDRNLADLYSDDYETGIEIYTGTDEFMDVLVEVKRDPYYYRITSSAGEGGSISPLGDKFFYKYSSASQKYTITPDNNYRISKLIVDGVEQTVSSEYKFTNIKADHTIRAEFQKINCYIEASAGEGGSISPSGTVTVPFGDYKTFTITPNAGYEVDKLLIDGEAVEAANSYTFLYVTEDHTIEARFKVKSYDITASANAGGTISPNGTTSVQYGGSQSYTITVNTGYVLDSLTVDGKTVAAATSYTFSNVTADHTITATFKPITYTITASAGAGGKITPSGNTSVQYGKSQSYTITANAGYVIDTLTVDNKAVTAANSYTFTNVTANHSINVTFKAQITTYTITASAGWGGSISPSGSVSVNKGASQTFNFIANNGYVVDKVTVDGVSVTATNSYTFYNVTANHSINVTFKQKVNSYTITSSAGAGGTISPNGTTTVQQGKSQSYTITPNSGYKISTLTVDGKAVTATSSYTFRYVSANHTIHATFEPKSYTITASAGTGGKISPSGSTMVQHGKSQSYTITPNTGYEIDTLTVDGKKIASAASYAFSNVTANHTISVKFRLIEVSAISIGDIEVTTITGVDLLANGASIKSGYGVFAKVPVTATGVKDITVTCRYDWAGIETVTLEPNGDGTYSYPVNPSSVTDAKCIYIPVATPDSTYQLEFVVTAHSNAGQKLTKSARVRITVKGSMYEDDFTGSGRR